MKKLKPEQIYVVGVPVKCGQVFLMDKKALVDCEKCKQKLIEELKNKWLIHQKLRI